MRPFLDWLETRWRTRGEYAMRARGFLFRYGVPFVVRVGGALVVVAAVMFALFWVLSAPSRAGAREGRIEGLRDRIVEAAASGRLPPSTNAAGSPGDLSALVAAGVITPDDAAFLADQRITYHAISRGSPDTAVVFRKTGRGDERRYRVSGTEDYYTVSTTADGRLSVVIGPGRPRPATGPGGRGRQTRSLTVRDVDTGREIGMLEVPEWADATWSPDGRFLAVETQPETPGTPTSGIVFVLAVPPAATGLTRLELPASVELRNLIRPEDAAVVLQDASVRVLRWRGPTLAVESAGHGWIGPPGQPGSESIVIRVRFALEVSANGVRELSREVGTYARQ